MSDAGYEDDEVNAFICISKGKFKYHESGEFKIERFSHALALSHASAERIADALADMRRQRDEARADSIQFTLVEDLAEARDALADMRRQARQDALALREAVKQVERLTRERDHYRQIAGDLLASAHRAERERDRYKALAEGERERIANIMRYHTHANKNAIDAILGLPAPSLPAPEERQPADKDRDG